MTKKEYQRSCRESFDKGKVSAEIYDCMLLNTDIFCGDDIEAIFDNNKLSEDQNIPP